MPYVALTSCLGPHKVCFNLEKGEGKEWVGTQSYCSAVVLPIQHAWLCNKLCISISQITTFYFRSPVLRISLFLWYLEASVSKTCTCLAIVLHLGQSMYTIVTYCSSSQGNWGIYIKVNVYTYINIMTVTVKHKPYLHHRVFNKIPTWF